MPKCKYCNKEFVKDSTFATHVCEKKRRHLAKDERHARMGFQTFVRFYELTTDSNKKKSFDDFVNSPYYNAFIKFGSFLSNINPLYPQKYVDWIIQSGTKIDHWCDDAVYEKYVVHLIFNESVETALERGIMHMQTWGQEKSLEWEQYFRQVSDNRGVYDIKDGKISPWIILNCESGKEFIGRLNDKQLESISGILAPEIWLKKFKTQKADIKLVRDILSMGDL